jgi:leucyl/phenylalanyl-tRNA--protein transferase
MTQLTWLDPDGPPESLPPASSALRSPNGLVAVGGSLSPEWLVHAYRHGLFPWYSEGEPILWWSPNPRAVLFPAEFRCSRSLAKSIRNRGYVTRIDTAFTRVVVSCAGPRGADPGTWITADMARAYEALHARGLAHSIETWHADQLVGGLYGVAIGRVFFGESMFSRERDASKVALARLVDESLARDVAVIDCQMETGHLSSLGSRAIPRREFLRLLALHARPELSCWPAVKLQMSARTKL